MQILLDEKKPYYKANLHCHSILSDGKMTVEELKTAYMQQGYSVVAFTDHEHLIDNSYLNDENFLAITACEVAIKEFPEQSTLVNMAMRVCHLNFYALDPHNTITPCYEKVYDHYVNEHNAHLIRYEKEYKRRYDKDGVNEMIRIANEQGFIVSYNHPTWSLEDASRYLQYENLWAVEIHNTSCAKVGMLTDEHALDDFLRADKPIFCTAADDNHQKADMFGGWVQINAPALTYANIMTALQKGNFYASTGVDVYSLVRDGNEVTIRTSPCKQITLTTKGRRVSTVRAEENETICQATFALRKTDGHFRIRVTDEKGRSAYTQAYSI